MNNVNKEFLERYQKQWEADPNSRIFAPLAEAYRQSGQLLEALKVCRHGVHRHPQFSGGWFQLAKIHFDLKQIDKAREALKKAVQIAPENIQAHKLLADVYLVEKLPKEALKCFKMVLLLSPDNQKVKKIIQRLESLTADEYNDETFDFDLDHLFAEPAEGVKIDNQIESSADSFDAEIEGLFPLDEVTKTQKKILPPKFNFNEKSPLLNKDKEHWHTKAVTLVDALLVRNEFEKAQTVISNYSKKWGITEELNSLLSVIHSQKDKSTEIQSLNVFPALAPKDLHLRHLKIKKLENILTQIERRKRAI